MTTQGSNDPTPERPSRRFSAVVAQFAAVNVAVRFAAVISSPLVARALGPEGRGEYAAILVPLTVTPILLCLGLNLYVTRATARGKPLNTLIGSVGAILLPVALLTLVGAAPAAAFFADGRDTVETFLFIGFLTTPIGLVATVLVSVSQGQERWPRVIVAQLIPHVGWLVSVVALYATDALTVASAATVTLVMGVLQVAPNLYVLRLTGRPRIDRAVVREALPFGLKVWLTAISTQANARLDQLLMIRMVSSRELGLYATGVTVASLSGLLTTALVRPLLVRVARGDARIAARAVRVTLLTIVIPTVVLLPLAPVVVTTVFGTQFADSASMVRILLIGALPLAGTSILASALGAANHPGTAARGQLLALLVTVPGLFLLIPKYGGDGAALVSVVAYSISFAFLLIRSRRWLGGTLADYLIPRREDVRWGMALATGFARRRKGGPSDQ